MKKVCAIVLVSILFGTLIMFAGCYSWYKDAQADIQKLTDVGYEITRADSEEACASATEMDNNVLMYYHADFRVKIVGICNLGLGNNWVVFVKYESVKQAKQAFQFNLDNYEMLRNRLEYFALIRNGSVIVSTNSEDVAELLEYDFVVLEAK